MQNTALTWLAFELTRESKWAAGVNAAQIVPTFFLGLWGGTLADRWPKRTLIFVTQTAFLVLALLLAALTWGGVVTPWQLLAVAAANGFVQALDLPARLAFVMDMAGREDIMNAVGLNSVLFNVARAIGPALAGLVLLWIKPWACFLLNALSYVAVLWALAQMDISGASVSPTPAKGWRAMLGGLRYLARHGELAYLVILAGFVSFFGWPSQNLLPELAKAELADRHPGAELRFQKGTRLLELQRVASPFGTASELHNAEDLGVHPESPVLGTGQLGYGLMLSGTGIGALIAAWAVATFGSVQLRKRLIGTGVVTISAGLMGLALAHDLVLDIGCCGLIGFGLILFLATSQSVVQLGSGENNRGVLMGIWAVTLSGAVPLGNLLAGPAADRWGVEPVLICEGSACAVAALVLWVGYGARSACSLAHADHTTE
jgi:MFS family permease